MATHALDYHPFPEVQPTGAPGDDYQHIQTNPDMFGGAVARGEQALGQGIEKAGTTTLDTEIARQTLNNEVHANEKLTWLASQGTQRLEKFKQLEGKAAAMQLPDFQAKLIELQNQTLEGESPAVKAHLSRSSAALIDRYQSYAASHAATQERHWHDKTATDGAATWGNQAILASLNGTWDDVDAFLAKSDHQVEDLYGQRMFDRDAIDAEVAKNRGANVRAIIKAHQEVGDIRTAQSIFDKYKDGMDRGSVVAALGALRTGTARLEGNSDAEEASGRVPIGGKQAKPIGGVPPSFIDAVKKSEGYIDRAEWDFKQHSIGYGTKAKYPGEVASREELEKRFEGEFSTAAKFVDSINPNLDAGSRAALASLTFNAGTAWASAGLGEAVRSGNIDAMRERFMQYNRAGGEVRSGLVSRRTREAAWFGQGESPSGGAPTVDRTVAFEDVLRRTDGDPQRQSFALTRLSQIYTVYQSEAVARNSAFDIRLKDSLAQVYATGDLATPLTQGEFIERYAERGPQAYNDYLGELQIGSAATAARTMTLDQQAVLLNRTLPQPDAPGFAAAQDRYERLNKEIRLINKQREDDPAASVASDPAVKTAQTSVKPDKTESVQVLAATRMAAQAALGIPEDAQSPITKEEALRLTVPLRTMLPGQERAALTKIAKEFQQMFGDYAGIAFEYALRAHRIDQATAAAAASVMRRLKLGQPTTDAAEDGDRATEVGAAVRATGFIGSTYEPSAPAGSGLQAATGVAPPAETGVSIPRRAIDYLRENPGTAAKFDKEFGEGAAKKILGQYPVHGAVPVKKPAAPTATVPHDFGTWPTGDEE